MRRTHRLRCLACLVTVTSLLAGIHTAGIADAQKSVHAVGIGEPQTSIHAVGMAQSEKSIPLGPAVMAEAPASLEEAVGEFNAVRRTRALVSRSGSRTTQPTHAALPTQQRLGAFTVTAYALSVRSTGKLPGQAGFGVTASGTHAVVGRTIAVDPSVIPIGTVIFIDLPGIGWRLAEDTGGAVRGRHIDLLLPSDAAAVQFGVKRLIPVYAIPR